MEDEPPGGSVSAPEDPCEPDQDLEAAEFLDLARRLGPRDAATLSAIVRKTSEICDTDGEESALAVLDQIERILRGDAPDA